MRLAYDVLLLGDYFFDQIYSGLPQFPELGREICGTGVTTTGGAMYITAVALHRLGARVGWPAYFGSDYYSQFVRKLALDEGLNLALAKDADHPYRLVTTSIPYQGERAFLTYADPKPDDFYAHWLASLERCDFGHLHISGLLPMDCLKPILALARARGATISADSSDEPYLQKPVFCRGVLSQIDLFMPNAREAQLITETEDIDSALRGLMEVVEIAAIKDGANGVWIGRRGEVTHVPAIQVGPVVDTTGAGDCFNAGFLFGYAVKHAPLHECGLYGNICGGFSVTGVGGATAAPTYAMLQDWLAKTTLAV